MSEGVIARKQWRGVNYPFLFFLILLTQSSIPLKPLAFIFIFFSTSTVPVRIDKNSMGFFYLVMIGYSFFSVFSYFHYLDPSYFVLFLLGLTFWILCFVAFQFLSAFVNENSNESIDATIRAFFTFNTIVCFFQIFSLLLTFDGVNPFENQSSGDKVFGIFANSSVNLVVNSFYVFYFFFKGRKIGTIIAIFLCLSTAYMSGIVILMGVTGYIVFTSSRLKTIHRISILAGGFIVLMALWYGARNNVIYSKEILESALTDRKPRKLVSFIQTKDYMLESPGHFLFGAGMGNFSSRLAFVADGEYVQWYPRTLLYRSIDFTQNHFALWNANLLFDRNARGTSNQPFSVYNQMLGEYGIIGFALLIFFYFRPFARNYSRLTYGKILFLLLLGYFLLDYWFEYFSITIVAELMFLFDLKETAATRLASKT